MASYRFVTHPVVQWPIEVAIPGDADGARQTFTAHFRLMPRSERAELLGEGDEGRIEFVRAALVGWDGIEDEDGQPLGWTPQTRDALIDLDHVFLALIRGYARALAGADAKN